MPGAGRQKDFLDEEPLPSAGAGSPPRELADLYRVLVRTRLVSDAMRTLQRQGRVAFHPPWSREEAAHAAAVSAMAAEDWVFPGVRAAGVLFQRGMPLEDYVHHVFGSAADQGLGRRLPGFPTWRQGRVLSASGSPGASIAQAAGFAWGARLRGEERAVLALFGWGSRSQPDFHTGLNFAGVYRAPVVFFCHTFLDGGDGEESEEAALEARRWGDAYGIEGRALDGTDLQEVRDATAEAARKARTGGGPTLLQAALPAGEDWDPVAALRRRLEEGGLWSVERERGLCAELEAGIEKATAAAAAAGPPPAASLFQDVYAAMPPHLGEQERECLRLLPDGRFAPEDSREE